MTSEIPHPVEPTKLLSDYWSNHADIDLCLPTDEPVRPAIPFQQLPILRSTAKDYVLNYTGVEPRHTFQEGEKFDAYESYPGTIISYGIEELTTARDGTKRYFEFSYYGVVSKYIKDGKRMRAIIPVVLLQNGTAIANMGEEPVLTVGKVEHRKSTITDESVIERTYRVTRLSLIMQNS